MPGKFLLLDYRESLSHLVSSNLRKVKAQSTTTLCSFSPPEHTFVNNPFSLSYLFSFLRQGLEMWLRLV
jgi:hypothetical protein